MREEERLAPISMQLSEVFRNHILEFLYLVACYLIEALLKQQFLYSYKLDAEESCFQYYSQDDVHLKLPLFV